MSKVIKVMEDLAADRFWIQLPDNHEFYLKCLKTLIPYEHRDNNKGWGWIYEMRAWTFPMDYMNDALLLLDECQVPWKVEFVEVLDAPDLSWQENAEVE